MVLLRVEDEVVGGTSDVVSSLPQLRVLVEVAHVRVAEDDHVLAVAQVNVRVLGLARRLVARRRLDMVVVMVDGEGALEQRFQPVLAYPYPGPADIVPAVPPLQPCGALVNLVLQPLNGLLPRYRAVGVEVCDLAAIDEKVVVGLEAEADALPGDVKGKVEGRYGSHAVCLCEDVGILGKRDASQRRAGVGRGGCYGGKADGDGGP